MTTLKTIATTIILAANVIVPAPAAADGPGKEFTGTAVVDGPNGTRSMPVTLVANRYSTVAEVQKLGEVLANGGQSAVLGAIRYRNDGELRLGAEVRPISLVAAEKTSDGHRILFLTGRRIDISEQQLGKDSLDYPFGIAIIEIDGFSGLGEGALHAGAALAIDADGHIEIDDYDGRDGHFRDLRRVR
ncbi:MAG: hypothetical protein V2I67_09880 [Thermoanaerobaculales bacterium]|jgi:hypothetical protein|nr:hypothetical protein [Thermoanaerobaculales bacterium]